jgi:hypothetical protein
VFYVHQLFVDDIGDAIVLFFNQNLNCALPDWDNL